MLKDEIRGNWKPVLLELGLPARILSGQNQPCPFCGGKDRFRFTDFQGCGFYFCNQCGPGNGFVLAAKFLEVSVPEVYRRVREISLGSLKVEKKPKSQTGKIWLESVELSKNDPVCCYLRDRGISDVSSALHFHPRVFDGKKYHPSMVAPITDSKDELMGVHITYLHRTATGWRSTGKRMRKFGETISGGSVRLWGVPLEHLGVAEGIETALAVWERFGVRCWAAMGTSGLVKFQLPDPLPSKLTIYCDNDRHFTGAKAAYTLANRLVLNGFQDVDVQEPERGDFLDDLNADFVEVRRKSGT